MRESLTTIALLKTTFRSTGSRMWRGDCFSLRAFFQSSSITQKKLLHLFLLHANTKQIHTNISVGAMNMCDPFLNLKHFQTFEIISNDYGLSSQSTANRPLRDNQGDFFNPIFQVKFV